MLTDACWALSYLSDGTNDKIQEVIQAGVCRRLVELLLCAAPRCRATRARVRVRGTCLRCLALYARMEGVASAARNAADASLCVRRTRAVRVAVLPGMPGSGQALEAGVADRDPGRAGTSRPRCSCRRCAPSATSSPAMTCRSAPGLEHHATHPITFQVVASLFAAPPDCKGLHTHGVTNRLRSRTAGCICWTSGALLITL